MISHDHRLDSHDHDSLLLATDPEKDCPTVEEIRLVFSTDPFDVESTETQVSAELLLRDVVAFLRARPEGRAPSGLVVDAFQDRVGPTQHALFRRLLKVAATLEKNPPNAAGAGGGAAWVLKDEFR